MPNIPFIDLQLQYQKYKAEIDAAIAKVLAHGHYVQGPEIVDLEQQLAKFVGVKNCIAVSSGTAALQVIMMSLDLEPGDEIIMPDFSFFATAEVPMLLGVKPVFVDIDPLTYNVDPEAVRRAITKKTKAILPVCLYGQCADMTALGAIAKEHDLWLIEDAAQSIGAKQHGKQSGSFGTAAATSFFPSKALGAYGDAGACFTNDDQLAERIRIVRCHGESKRYHHVALGVNARMASIQAAVLSVKLKYFSEEIALRQQCAARYDELLQGIVTTPTILPENESVYAQYTIAVENRDQVVAHLRECGVPTAVHYPQVLHRQPIMQHYYADIEQQTNCPQAKLAAEKVLSLPFGPWLKQEDQQRVATALQEALEG